MALHLLDLFGVAMFAISGAHKVDRKSMNLFGVVVEAVLTAIGRNGAQRAARGASGFVEEELSGYSCPG